MAEPVALDCRAGLSSHRSHHGVLVGRAANRAAYRGGAREVDTFVRLSSVSSPPGAADASSLSHLRTSLSHRPAPAMMNLPGFPVFLSEFAGAVSGPGVLTNRRLYAAKQIRRKPNVIVFPPAPVQTPHGTPDLSPAASASRSCPRAGLFLPHAAGEQEETGKQRTAQSAKTMNIPRWRGGAASLRRGKSHLCAELRHNT